MLIPIDLGALVQLKTMCEKSSVEVYGEENNKDSPNIVKNGLKHFAGQPLDVILIDTAGRHKEETDLLEEMSRINKAAEPDLALLVIDGTIGTTMLRSSRSISQNYSSGWCNNYKIR